MTHPDDNDLQQLRTVDEADVFKGGRHAATLTRTPNGIEFRYRADWIDAGAPPVATTLPVTPEPVVCPGGSLPAYFAGAGRAVRNKARRGATTPGAGADRGHQIRGPTDRAGYPRTARSAPRRTRQELFRAPGTQRRVADLPRLRHAQLISVWRHDDGVVDRWT